LLYSGLSAIIKTYLSFSFRNPGMGLPLRTVGGVPVRQVMTDAIVKGSPDESVYEIAEKMSKTGVGSVVIVDKAGKPVGIVTDGDVVSKVIGKGLDPYGVKVLAIMSTPFYKVDSEEGVLDALRKMIRLRINYLGVVYKGKLVGIVSLWDIAHIIPDLFVLVSERERIISARVVKAYPSLSGYCDVCARWSDYLLEVDNRYLCEECRIELGL